MKKFLHEAKGCITRFKRTKDLKHLTDIWRLAVYYFFIQDILDIYETFMTQKKRVTADQSARVNTNHIGEL